MEPDVVRRVKPEEGNLMNDNDCGVDQLGYLVYAQALAKLLHGASPPITVGIFGPWGIGKTFLLKHVQGLLLRYQRQDAYDNAKPSSRSCVCPKGNTTEEDGPELNPLFKPKNKTGKSNMNRACRVHCVWIAFLATLLALIFVLLLLVLLPPPNRDPPAFGSDINKTSPTLQSKRLRQDGSEVPDDAEAFSGRKPKAKIYVVLPDTKLANLTDDGTPAAFSTTVPPTTDETEVITSNVRMYLILSLVLLTGMVFAVFCCCVADTNSKCWIRFYRNFKLVWYAAFTRIPSVAVNSDTEWIEAYNPYMVTTFNDERAPLRYAEPRDEEIDGVRRSKDRRLPKKYIFVNYHAWQYAGSDTLWAGIVTNLAEAIEAEFGAVCARLFRMFEVERPSKSGPIKVQFRKEDPRGVYVKFGFPSNETWNASLKRQRVLLVMKEYGVVSQCRQYLDHWWYVRFCSDQEASFAETALKLDNFQVRRGRPESEGAPEDSSELAGNEHRGVNDAGADASLVAEENGRQFTRSDNIPMQLRNTHNANGVASRSRRNASLRQPSGVSESNSNCCCCCLQSEYCCRWFCHFRKHPKTVCCGCPFLYFCILFVIVAVLFPVGICIMADKLELGILQSTRAIPIEVQIFSWLPAMVGVLIVALRFCWAMCNSQTERVRKALAGSAGSMGKALGFMNEVKREVMIMSQLINCVRFTHGIDYKVVITIDDLDRCPYDKVKSVLEAVSILLSDRSSPFLCLIGVDSRVAVKCIEEDMGELLLQAHLTGHEYLKKIINLPFCLPEVANHAKRKYVGGILDFAAGAVVERVADEPARNEQEPIPPRVAKARRVGDEFDAVGTDAVDINRIKTAGPESGDDQHSDDGQISPSTSTDGAGGAGLDIPPRNESQNERCCDEFSEFLFECIKILHGDGEAGRIVQQHMCGNPRNIKRILNVLMLSTCVMRCIKDRRTRMEYVALHSEGEGRRAGEARDCSAPTPITNADLRPQKNEFGRKLEDAADLVKWIVAADQWPYRISYILQVVEDCDRRCRAGLAESPVDQGCTLSQIYEEFVEPEIESNPNSAAMLSVDNDPAILRSFLRLSPTLTRLRISSLFPATLNLDPSLRNGIALQRARPKAAPKETTPRFHKVVK